MAKNNKIFILNTTTIKIIFLFIVLFVLISCNSYLNSKISYTKDIECKNEVKDSFITLLDDIFPEDNNNSVDIFKNSFTSSFDGAFKIYPQENTENIVLNIDIKNINNTIAILNENCKKNPILKLGKNNEITININVDNYESLDKFIPIISDKNFSPYLAKYNKTITREDYLEMISQVVSPQFSSDLNNSKIVINRKNKKQIEINLIDFILLHSPIVVTI